MRIIIFGISGLIGNSLFTYLSKDNNLKVYGTSRRNINFIQDNILYFEWSSKNRIKDLNSIINKCKPDLVINCIGITKHHQKKNKSDYINLNSNLPHEIARVSNELNAKFLQISTDCVFSGKLGNYDELAICDSKEIYGISKFNGEIIDNFNLTIRISTLGREIGTKNGLLEWFLNQEKRCFGYKSAFFSGITTYELSQIIINYIIPNIKLENLLAVDKWVADEGIIIYDDAIYDKTTNQWVRKIKPTIPSTQVAYAEYKKIMSVSQDRKTGFVTISIIHQSPDVAKKWVELVIEHINASMRKESDALASRSIEFLNQQANNSSIKESRDAIYQLILSQTHNLMTTAASESYVFRVIDSAIATEKKISPSRALICIIGTILGSVISIILIFGLHFRRAQYDTKF